MLTNREYDIYKIVHNAGKPIVASEVVSQREDLTINTVQAVLKKLLRMGLIKVGKIVYSGTVLARAYVPADEAPDILARMFKELYIQYSDFVDKDRVIDKIREV
jgi:predicted transcriptional regulator